MLHIHNSQTATNRPKQPSLTQCTLLIHRSAQYHASSLRNSITELRPTSNPASRLLHNLRRASDALIIDPTKADSSASPQPQAPSPSPIPKDLESQSGAQGMRGTYEGLSAPWNQSQLKPHPLCSLLGKLEHVFVEEPP